MTGVLHCVTLQYQITGRELNKNKQTKPLILYTFNITHAYHIV